MKFNPLYNFISPLTGRLVLKPNHILIGNEDGLSYQSSIFVDLQQDIIDLRRNLGKFTKLEKLSQGHLWIGDGENIPVQVKTIDTENMPQLDVAVFPYPAGTTLSRIKIPNPTFNPVSGSDWLMTGNWLPQIFAGSSNTSNTSHNTIVSSALALAQIKVAQVFKRMDATGFIVRSKKIDFDWDNPLMATVPDEIKELYGLQNDYTFQNAQALEELEEGILKNRDGTLTIASGGKIPITDDYVRPIDLEEEIEKEQATRTEADSAEELARVEADAAIEALITALQVEIESQIAALAGVTTIGALATVLGFIGVEKSGKAYGDFIRGQTLNVRNTWKSSDLNDEGHNAVGDYELRYPSGYSSSNRGHGTLWFDSKGRSEGHESTAGLRLFSWDSGGDHLGYDAPIAPVHIGIFGYQNKYHISPIPNPTPVYKGFIFESEFNNENKQDEYYRFPKKFGLYDVKRTISSLTEEKLGWDARETIFEYDYKEFSFYQKVKHNDHVDFAKGAEFQKHVDFQEGARFQEDVYFSSKGAIVIPVGKESERPLDIKEGALRMVAN